MIWFGFILVMLGVFVASQTRSDWESFLWPGVSAEPAACTSTPQTTQNRPPVGTERIAEESETISSGRPDPVPAAATPASDAIAQQPILNKLGDWFLNNLGRLRWVLGGLLITLGGWCLGGNPLRFLLDSALVLATVAVGMLLTWTLIGEWIWNHPSARWLAAAACLALNYFAHAAGRIEWPKVTSVIGFALIATAGWSVSQGVLSVEAFAPKLGERFASAAGEWKHEFTWGTVLLLTSIGVVMSRGRLMYFLNAVLLAALAYYCIQDGSQRVLDFSEQNWPDITLHDLSYVPPWRWMLAGELALLSLILLHLSLGVGAISVVFAAAWFGVSLQVDKEMGRDALLVYSNVHRVIQQDAERQANGLTSGAGGPADVLTGGFHRRTDREPSSPPPPLLTLEQKRAMFQTAGIRIGFVFVWTYLTAFLAGIIGASGLRLLIRTPSNRQWALIVLWTLVGGMFVYLSGIWPPAQNWQSRLASLVIPKTHVYAIWFTALLSCAFFGAFALRTNSDYLTWLKTGVWIVFTGTAMTLISLAMLIKFGGLPSMPVWKYVAIALGQSGLMWVLLLHQTGREHRSTIVHAA